MDFTVSILLSDYPIYPKNSHHVGYKYIRIMINGYLLFRTQVIPEKVSRCIKE